MRIRWLIDVGGMVHGNIHGVRRGDIQDAPDAEAARYYQLGYAQTDLKGELGPPYRPGPAQSRAEVTRVQARKGDRKMALTQDGAPSPAPNFDSESPGVVGALDVKWASPIAMAPTA